MEGRLYPPTPGVDFCNEVKSDFYPFPIDAPL